MLVDDVDISNILLKKLISKIALTAQVFDFTQPEKAYISLQEINPDLIFLDLNMPLINGWQFLDKMKEDNHYNKVIIVTSSTSILDKEQSKNYSNIIDFFEKPVSKEKLIECFSALTPASY